MHPKSRATALGFFLGLQLFSAAAYSACESDKELLDAIDRWQDASSVELAPALRDTLIRDFCIATASLISTKRATESDVRSATPGVIAEFLDRSSDLGASMISIGAVLRSKFGTGGLALPGEREFGLVELDGCHLTGIDTLRVNERDGRPRRLLMRPPGALVVKGLVGQKLRWEMRTTVVASEKKDNLPCPKVLP